MLGWGQTADRKPLMSDFREKCNRVRTGLQAITLMAVCSVAGKVNWKMN